MHQEQILKDNELYQNLDSFIQAAISGYEDQLPEFIKRETHLKDERGTALYMALANGHKDCVFLLKDLTPIKNKHYYAAGLAGRTKGPEFFAAIKPVQYSRGNPNNPQTPAAVFAADLEGLHTELVESSPNHQEKSRWLFNSIKVGTLLCVRLLLEDKAPIEPQHYYAAGLIKSKRIYELLKSFDTKEPLPENFYTQNEIQAYIDLSTTDVNSSSLSL